MYRNFEGGCMIVGLNAALKGNFYPGKGFVIIITLSIFFLLRYDKLEPDPFIIMSFTTTRMGKSNIKSF